MFFRLWSQPPRLVVGLMSGASANGIGNVAFLPAGCVLGDVTTFDTGPGNMVMGRIN